jgi:hypothetical protein
MRAKISTILASLLLISVLSNVAYADNFVLSDQTSCEDFFGSWDSETSTCSVSELNNQNNDVLEIASGVTLRINTLLQNHGNLINKGTLIVTDTAEFGNVDYFENLGDFQNFGTTFVVGKLDNKNTSTISNPGRIELGGTGEFNNDAAMNSPGALDIDGSSIFNNFKTLDFGTGASVTINPSADFNNEGTILFCNWTVDGTITGSGTITSTCFTENRPPTLPITDLQANEEESFNFGIEATDPDFGQTLTYSLSGAPDRMTIDSTTGLISWFPDETQGGSSYTFDIIVTDDGEPSLSDTKTASIRVNEVNKAPVLDPISAPSLVNEGDQIGFTATASDTDIPAQTIMFSLGGAPASATIDSVSGIFSWTPTESEDGTHTFDIVATDNGMPPLQDIQTITVTVNEINEPPSIAPIDPQTASEGIEFLLPLLVADPDLPPQTLIFTLVNAPPAAVITPGVFNWTPNESEGGTAYTGVEIHVSDGFFDVFTTFDITVAETNSPPSLNAIQAQTVNEGTPVIADADATDPDMPIQAISYSLSGAPVGMTINSSTGLIEWTPSESQGPGLYIIDVIATDNHISPLSDTELLSITINEVNTPPTISAIDPQTIDEHVELTLTALAADVDEPANNLTFSLGPGTPSGATIDPDTGVFSWTPGETNGNNSYSVEIRVSDGFADAFTTFDITVAETNSPPSIDPIPTQSANENELFEYQVIASDPDVPSQTISYSLSGAPDGMSINESTGLIIWTPGESADNESFTFSVIVTDDHVPAMSDTEIMTVTLSNVNSPPILGLITTPLTVAEGELVTFTATATDNDLPQQVLTFILLNPQPGMTINPSTGVFSWVPSELQGDGSAVFDVIVIDSGLPEASDSQTVTINVIETNSPPTVSPIPPQQASENNQFSFQVVASDPDVPSTGTISYSLSGAPDGMAIDSTNGLISWTPTPSQIGTFSFNVVVTDGVSPVSVQASITVFKVFCDRPEYEFVVITGTAKNDKLIGTAGDDLIRGLDGDDKIQGKGGNDCLIGGNGIDRIWGGEGDDTILGEAGSDKLYGQDGNDIILGGDGNDKVWGGKGMDNIDGGSGADRIHANQDNDTVAGGDGNDWLGGGIGNDVIRGGIGDDKLFGRQGNDDLFGESGNDFIHGGQGNDDHFGGDGTDKCYDKQGTNTFSSCESRFSFHEENDEGEEDDEGL